MAIRASALFLALAAVLAGAPMAAAASKARPTERVLKQLYRERTIDTREYRERVILWRDAVAAARRLKGSPARNLAGVLRNSDLLAARRQLDKPRLVPVFTILERNYDWFAVQRGSAASYGARRTFPGSPVQWQFYPGHGWQIQPLANWGAVNGLLDRNRTRRALRHASALLQLTVEREGRPAFEYYFPFSGGPPGWTSAMPQASAMAALARLWQRTGDQQWLDASRALMGLFELPPPAGVRLATPAGAHYLLYSQNADLLVGNGFASTLVSLYDYVGVTGDGQARALLDAGLAEASTSFPSYDTGAWSLYHRHGSRAGRESDLHYHQLFSYLLRRLCKRIAADPWCALGTRFKEYESQPVALRGLTRRASRTVLAVHFWASKIGRATVLVKDGSRVIRSKTLPIKRGKVVARFRRPRDAGTYTLEVAATSLNGRESARAANARLSRKPRR